ncbi:MAG: hypothetical protein P0Y64_03530 [Candidatus Sphingomonas colombiensis]|nr:hypothetical protein [Sphingomonas sp.]WEK43913.1 MAG: hypothetical protein P0Y64_03530 [Sphingomonas sp.]
MTNPAIAEPWASGSIDPKMLADAQALRTGLELARANQLTMLRLQLALHKSNRRAAMQALDNLLDVDAEMEGLVAALTNTLPSVADETGLSGFVGRQKAAIAIEKHALTGGDWSNDSGSLAIVAPGDWAVDAALPEQSAFSAAEPESDAGAVGNKRWGYVVAAMMVVVFIGVGLAAYLWPMLPATLHEASARILTFASRAG